MQLIYLFILIHYNERKAIWFIDSTGESVITVHVNVSSSEYSLRKMVYNYIFYLLITKCAVNIFECLLLWKCTEGKNSETEAQRWYYINSVLQNELIDVCH